MKKMERERERQVGGGERGKKVPSERDAPVSVQSNDRQFASAALVR